LLPEARAHWLGFASLLAIAVVFAANHVAARLAFDHGVSVATAVAVRSAGTALAVAGLLALHGTSVGLPRATLGRALAIGLALSIQSFCLYSAVARLPVALALLTFNTFPILLAALSWATGGERPAPRTLAAMPVILFGLALALDVFGIAGPGGATGADDPARFAAGVGFALAASASFAGALVLVARWLGAVDGRVRTFWTMATVAVVVSAAGASADAFALPRDPTGWLGLALLTVFYGAAITALFVVLPRLGAVNHSPVLNVEPIASMVLAWMVLDQRIAAVQIGGALLVVGAIVWMSTGRR
jgi:drug/metabolite transporter (DMT)-like permease